MKKRIFLLTIALAVILTVSVIASAAAPAGFIGGAIATINKSGYDSFNGAEITANNSSTQFGNFSFIADNKNLNAWYIDVIEDIHDTLEVAYKVGGNYYIVTFVVDGPGKYWIADSRGSNGANMVKVGAYMLHVHNYTGVVTPPTCTEDGYTTYTCECGDSYIADIVDALGHDYEHGDLEFVSNKFEGSSLTPYIDHFAMVYLIPYKCSRCGDIYIVNIESSTYFRTDKPVDAEDGEVSTARRYYNEICSDDMTWEEFLNKFDDPDAVYYFSYTVLFTELYPGDNKYDNFRVFYPEIWCAAPWDNKVTAANIEDIEFTLTIDNSGLYYNKQGVLIEEKEARVYHLTLKGVGNDEDYYRDWNYNLYTEITSVEYVEQ